MSHEGLGEETLLQHLGETRHPYGAVAPPIYQASNFAFESCEAMASGFDDIYQEKAFVYSRVSNPTVALAEKKIAALEGAERCHLFGSGQGAITSALLSNLEAGAHVVCVDTCYGPVKELLNDYLPKFGVSTTYVDGRTLESIFDAVRPESKVIYLESPSTFFFRLQDLEGIAREAKPRGIATMVDNTYCTPLYQKPLALGIDYSLSSGSKYFGGHSDLCCGSISASDERLEKIQRFEINLFGNALAPFAGWLVTRGLRTLSLRLARHQESANFVADWISKRPEVEITHHVGLSSYPQKELAARQMKGTSGLFSFETKNQDQVKLRKFVDSLKIFQRAVSWGGHESLAILVDAQPLDYPASRRLVRLFIGLEDPKDLIADLEQAFAASEL